MEQRKKNKPIFEWLQLVASSLAVVLFVFVFCIRVVGINGPSMNPTLHNGERVVVQTLFYTPKSKDIIVVDSYNGYGKPLVKRVIGVGGDEIDINFATGEVFVNGVVIDEPYIKAPTTQKLEVDFPLTVPNGHVFIMGDNRPNSKDSRSSEIGFIDENDILGRVFFRIMPLNSIGVVK